ncbi:aminoacyl-tRNA hydrolase [Panacagrimonas sp.]|uniref:aminoacyl-tRNA hydrolase n=1 Tax=Panacagrimonas sp. TaxID=2480088 RepID=UPI003B51A873
MNSELQVALIGLGNPGPEYARTRHNAGFWLADRFAERHRAGFRAEGRFFGELARVRTGAADVFVLKPGTYMNRSGQAVAALTQFYKLTPAQVLVAHDELDLPTGAVKLKLGGGHGGHNGLRDIHKPLGDGYRRIRIGVGHPGERHLVMPYLTQQRPDKTSEEAILQGIERALDAVEMWLDGSWDKAVQALHTAS